MVSIEAFYPELAKSHNIVITMHQKPDGDALGSSLALARILDKLKHQVIVVAPTNWPVFLNWMPGCDAVIDAEANKKGAEQALQQAGIIICLDFNTLSRTKSLANFIATSNAIKVLIDHHQEPQTDAFHYGISNTGKGSTAEMVFDFILGIQAKQLIDDSVAQCLYAGVMTDTGSFRFPSTTASAHRMIAELMDIGFPHYLVHEKIFDTFLENRLRFFGHVLLNRMDVNYELNTVLIAIPKVDLVKFDIKTGDTEGLVNYPLSMLGIKFAAIVIDRDEERRWSFRSKGEVDVNTFARKFFEGGGHKNAAGGRSSASLEDTVTEFKAALPSMELYLK